MGKKWKEKVIRIQGEDFEKDREQLTRPRNSGGPPETIIADTCSAIVGLCLKQNMGFWFWILYCTFPQKTI